MVHVFAGMHAPQSVAQICGAILIGAGENKRARHQHIGVSGAAMLRQKGARQRAHPSPRPIARHRFADFAAGGQTQPDMGAFMRADLRSADLRSADLRSAHLQNKAGRDMAAAAAMGFHKLAALPQGTNDRRFLRHPTPNRVQPRAAARLDAQALAPFAAAARQNFHAMAGRHAGAKAVPPLADKIAGLVGALHEPKEPKMGEEARFALSKNARRL